MANLIDLTASEIVTASLNDPAETPMIDVDSLSLDGFYTRKIVAESISTSYTSSATRRVFTLGPVFPIISGFKAGSLIHLSFHMPTRNDSDLWGGFYIEPQVSFDSVTWHSLGGSGFDIMLNGGRAIQSYFNSVLFDPQQTADFDMQFRFYFACYDPSVVINGSHAINTISGTAPLDSNVANANQHFATIKVEELAKFSGV